MTLILDERSFHTYRKMTEGLNSEHSRLLTPMSMRTSAASEE